MLPRRYLLIAVLLLALYACAPVDTPPQVIPTASATPAPAPQATGTRRPLLTRPPTRTITPQPSASITPGPSPTSTVLPPLEAHTFSPGWVLAQMGELGEGPYSPDFVLYADGSLLTRACDGERCAYNLEQLDRAQTCAWLNQIDRLGFLDYDPSSFQSPAQGGEVTLLRVDAWRQNAAALPYLARWMENPAWYELSVSCARCTDRPLILAALADTFRLFSGYRPQSEKAYLPTRLAVMLDPPVLAGKVSAWTSSDISAPAMLEGTRCDDPAQRRALVLEGEAATRLVETVSAAVALGNPPVFDFDGVVMEISTHWLLPHQSAPGCGSPRGYLPDPSEPPPAFTLACSPVDSTLLVSTP